MDQHDTRLNRYASLLSEIITVIMALAFTNALTQAVTAPWSRG